MGEWVEGFELAGGFEGFGKVGLGGGFSLSYLYL